MKPTVLLFDLFEQVSFASPFKHLGLNRAAQPFRPDRLRLLSMGCSIATAIAVMSLPVRAQAQALPTPLPPLPGTTNTSGEQFLVIVEGTSDPLLQQVRQIEPGAFVNYINGKSVIQVGRFNNYDNAQARASELSLLGLGAQVQSTSAVSAPIAVTPPAPDYSLSMPATSPPPQNTISTVPSAIEFGQVPPFQTTPSPSDPGAVPPLPMPPSSTPPSVGALPNPPAASVNTGYAQFVDTTLSGYFVVVPGAAEDLPSLANQLVNLGVPSSLVRIRTSPRGPHIAVGPYNDRDLAEDWTRFLRESGIRGARVHFE